MSETAISRAIREALAFTGATVTRHQSGTVRIGGRTIRMGDPGWPDLIGYDREGRFVGIEVKTPSGRVEPHQAAWHEQARKAGCRVGVARSVSEAVDIVTGVEARCTCPPLMYDCVSCPVHRDMPTDGI